MNTRKKAAKVAAKRTAAKKSTSSKIKIEWASPGSLPERKTIKAGTKLMDLVPAENNYVVRVNGIEVGSEYVLKNNDSVRIGVNTKNN